MDSAIPPESLLNLILNLEFLGGISNNQKYCFVTKQYVPNKWYFAVWRTFLGESQETNGISMMERICRDATQQWERYKNDKYFSNMLLDAIVKARHGLQKCHDNYISLQKAQTATSIRFSVIGPLDKLIPEDRKYTEGILVNSVSSNMKESSDNFEDVDI